MPYQADIFYPEVRLAHVARKAHLPGRCQQMDVPVSLQVDVSLDVCRVPLALN